MEENRRTGKTRFGGSQFRRVGKRIYVTALYRGRKFHNSFSVGAVSYANAKRWYISFKNLKAKEREFWRYAPHVYHAPDRFITYGFRNERRRTRAVFRFDPDDASSRAVAWERACAAYYEFTQYDPVRDGKNVVIKDFGGWYPPEFQDIELVRKQIELDLVRDDGLTLGVSPENH